MAAIRRVLTANLKPGMITSEDVFTDSNYRVLEKNTILDTESIQSLRVYSIKSILVGMPDSGTTAAAPKSIDSEKTYFERVQATKEFIQFQDTFTNTLGSFEQNLNDIVVKNDPEIIDNMLKDVKKILNCCRNPLHLLDMMQCMRSFDDLTYTHSMNVSLICNVIGTWLNLSDDNLSVLITAGMLHDVGKLKIPEEIITKPGRLTKEEFDIIKKHPQYGYEVLKKQKIDPRVRLAACQHHEKYNGSGYPLQLTGSQIDYFSSIVGIADVYDAMTADRCYRKGICPFEVIAHLEEERHLYEPGILYLFMKRTAEAYVNTEVKLSNGEEGRIVLLNNSQPSRPTILTSTGMYDLTKHSNIRITQLL